MGTLWELNLDKQRLQLLGKKKLTDALTTHQRDIIISIHRDGKNRF